jgi:adenylyltransferase/sulfurtransferase
MQHERYSRIYRFPGLAATQGQWQAASCAIIGLGGLGGGLAMLLARMGVARLVLIDRDTVGPENLGHQALYTTAHAASALPKPIAAVEVLTTINPEVELAAEFTNVTRHNIHELLASTTLVFDGCDNFGTRLLINDWALKTGTPYCYAGVVSGELSAMAVLPDGDSCLSCLLPEPPAAGEVPTCAAAGVYPPLLGIANAFQIELANRWLAGAPDTRLYALDAQQWQIRKLTIPPRPECPACRGEYRYLWGETAAAEAECSGTSASRQLEPAPDPALATTTLEQAGLEVRSNRFCTVVDYDGLRYTLFPSGKISQSGSADIARLDQFIASYLGV